MTTWMKPLQSGRLRRRPTLRDGRESYQVSTMGHLHVEIHACLDRHLKLYYRSGKLSPERTIKDPKVEIENYTVLD